MFQETEDLIAWLRGRARSAGLLLQDSVWSALAQRCREETSLGQDHSADRILEDILEKEGLLTSEWEDFLDKLAVEARQESHLKNTMAKLLVTCSYAALIGKLPSAKIQTILGSLISLSDLVSPEHRRAVTDQSHLAIAELASQDERIRTMVLRIKEAETIEGERLLRALEVLLDEGSQIGNAEAQKVRERMERFLRGV